ncbi:MAG: flavin reductase [Oscillospiraceae bacterium]|nr:flavin reductase [Oscillospiraceae bacterium]
MHCIKKITNDLICVGANDRRLAMFEGVYSVPGGVSYNSYLFLDDKTVLIDTVDKAVRQRFMENVTEGLKGRPLDYLVVLHMEPDHSAAIAELAEKYPKMKIVCNAKTLAFIRQFYDFDIDSRAMTVGENDTLCSGRHTLSFMMAPMVHWPEVMVAYDVTDGVLFSADAFGSFGASGGAVFADEVDFEKDYMEETRRYYANIVGKYGVQTASLLKKVSKLAVKMICPLHGFAWRSDLHKIIDKYTLWSSYEPEEQGVMIAYASIYGNTENAAEIIACSLRERGVRTVMFDVSVTPASEIVSAVFKWSHLVFASATYNAGIFVTMEALLNDLISHNIQNRTVALIENGSWAPASGGLMREKWQQCKNITLIENTVSIKSAVKPNQIADIDAMADAIVSTFPPAAVKTKTAETAKQDSDASKSVSQPDAIDPLAMFRISYGLFILTARENGKDNGCIINTAMQITNSPNRISIAVNKQNHTCGMIMKTGEFNLSVLSQKAPFEIFKQFGFCSGKDTDKFAKAEYECCATNGIRYIPEYTNGVICAKVEQTIDCETHMVFIAQVTQAFIASNEPSVTYQYYFDHIKQKPELPKENVKGFVCKVCGYIYEGDTLPRDIICPWCKHGADDFEPL